MKTLKRLKKKSVLKNKLDFRLPDYPVCFVECLFLCLLCIVSSPPLTPVNTFLQLLILSAVFEVSQLLLTALKIFPALQSFTWQRNDPNEDPQTVLFWGLTSRISSVDCVTVASGGFSHW